MPESGSFQDAGGERVIWTGRPVSRGHFQPGGFFPMMAFVGAWTAVAFYGVISEAKKAAGELTGGLAVTAMLTTMGVLMMLDTLRRRSHFPRTRYTLTDRRVIIQPRTLHGQGLSMPLSDIRFVEVSQLRPDGVGNVLFFQIEGTEGPLTDGFLGIPHAAEVAQRIRLAIAESRP